MPLLIKVVIVHVRNPDDLCFRPIVGGDQIRQHKDFYDILGMLLKS